MTTTPADIEAAIRLAIEADEARFVLDTAAHLIAPDLASEPEPLTPIAEIDWRPFLPAAQAVTDRKT